MADGRKKKFIKELQEKSRVRKESGLFTVDGPKMCREVPVELVREVYVTESFLKSSHAEICSDLLKYKGFETVTDSDMKQISDTVTPQGILVVAEQIKTKGIRDIVSFNGTDAPLLLILETLQDPGNLGTIIRAAEAAGVTGIIMNDTTADVYSPKVVRSTMGSLFRVPFIYVTDVIRACDLLKRGEFTEGNKVDILAADLNGNTDYTLYDYRKPCAFMIGNESKGLSEEAKSCASVRIRIPMEGKVESLNAAMAATVIGFEAARQRRL